MNTNQPWLNSYAQNIPHEIDMSEHQSIVSILDKAIEKYSARPAFSNFGKQLTYSEINVLSTQFANYLIHELKLKKGERIAIMMPNVLQYPIAIFGALRAGLTVVNTNPMYTARELKHQLGDSGATVLIVMENFAQTAQEIIHETKVKQVITTTVGEMLGIKGTLINFMLKHVKQAIPAFELPGSITFKQALALGKPHSLPTIDIRQDDIAFLQYTGGTTGVAKGAMLSHGNLVANMLQCAAWLGSGIKYGEEVIITALPLYHIFALTANCLVFMNFGGLNYLITNPRDMPGFIKELKKSGFTVITGVNTLFNGLLNTPGFDQLDFSKMRFTLGGGMAVQKSVAEKWKKATGVTLIEAYGLTETSPACCMNPMDLPDFNGAIGFPIPSTQCCIQDDDFNILPQGEIGELCVKGPQVMVGYWQRADETAKVIDSNGWLHTGDIAKMDENGYFYIVDRKKDIIIVSGFNVFPNEIEDVISAMPGVLEVAAVGVADEKCGEAIKIVVVKKDPNLSADDIKAHCREYMTGYKQPRIIEFRTELPKTNVGKILRRELRDAAKTD